MCNQKEHRALIILLDISCRWLSFFTCLSFLMYVWLSVCLWSTDECSDGNFGRVLSFVSRRSNSEFYWWKQTEIPFRVFSLFWTIFSHLRWWDGVKCPLNGRTSYWSRGMDHQRIQSRRGRRWRRELFISHLVTESMPQSAFCLRVFNDFLQDHKHSSASEYVIWRGEWGIMCPPHISPFF